MLAPGIIILEQSPRWESAAKRFFQGAELTIRPCRTGRDVATAWETMPGSVTVIDLSRQPEAGLRLIHRGADQLPPVALIVMLPDELAELEWPARELGACSVIIGNLTDQELGQLCLRWLPPVASTAVLRTQRNVLPPAST